MDRTNGEISEESLNPTEMWPLGCRRATSYRWINGHLMNLGYALADIEK